MWNEVLEGLIVVKRSGQRVEFNASKIAIAVKKAFDAVYIEADEREVYKVFEKVLTYINENYKERKTINVEDIQDIIENVLKNEKFENVLTSFQDYRQKRAASRKAFSEKQQHKFVKAIEKVESESNSVEATLTPNEVLNKFGRIISSEYAKSYILDTKYIRALEEGNIYIHNLDYFYLGFLPYLNLKISIKEDDEYLDEFLNEIINTKKEVSYGIGLNSLDRIVEKYLLSKYKKTLKKYLKKYLKLSGLIEFINFKKIEETINKLDDINDSESINTFTNNEILINIYKNALNDTYDDIKEILNITINRIFNTLRTNLEERFNYTISIGNHQSTLSKIIREEIIEYLCNNNYLNNIHVIFKIEPEKTNDYLTKLSSLIINKKNISLSFTHNSYNYEKYEAEYFSNGLRIFENQNDNIKSARGRMLVTSTSINLARLGLKYLNRSRNDFYNELDQIMEFTKNELLLAFEIMGNKNKENYNILFNGNVLGDERLEPGQKIRKILKSGNLGIGLIGLKECILCLEKDEQKQYELLINILNRLNKKCELFSEETKLNFNIFEPSDYHARKYFTAIDKSIYGINKNITDKPMYELIDTAKFIKDYKDLGTVQKLLTGGNLITIKLSNKVTSKKVIDLIKELIDADIGYVKIDVGAK